MNEIKASQSWDARAWPEHGALVIFLVLSLSLTE
jgi:hypothetical protein